MKLSRDRLQLLALAFKQRFRPKTRPSNLPKSSQVLSAYLEHRRFPTWTAFYLPICQAENDLFGQSHFNHVVNGKNYHVLRTAAFPFVKFHCTLRPCQDLSLENAFYNALKVANLGIPCFLYGLAGLLWAKHEEKFEFQGQEITLYFWYRETW